MREKETEQGSCEWEGKGGNGVQEATGRKCT